MSETIPEDVTRTASEAYDAYANGNWRDIRECIASAIMAERERCTRIAEKHRPSWLSPNTAHLQQQADGIADAIRRGDQP